MVGGITAENAQRDLQNKLREDPLFAIKMKEKASVDMVLHNPLKVKELQQRQEVKSSGSSVGTHRKDSRRSRSRSRYVLLLHF